MLYNVAIVGLGAMKILLFANSRVAASAWSASTLSRRRTREPRLTVKRALSVKPTLKTQSMSPLGSARIRTLA